MIRRYSSLDRDQSIIDSDNPRERMYDALDAANDERKDRALEAKRQAIPVIAQRTLDLYRLWDAALIAAPCGTIYVHESISPGAAAALRSWADAQGFAVDDRIFAALNDQPAYASLNVDARGCSIAVLRYRDATAAEVEAERPRTAPVAPVQERKL